MYRCVSSLPSVTFLVVRKGFVSGETEGREKFLSRPPPFYEPGASPLTKRRGIEHRPDLLRDLDRKISAIDE